MIEAPRPSPEALSCPDESPEPDEGVSWQTFLDWVAEELRKGAECREKLRLQKKRHFPKEGVAFV